MKQRVVAEECLAVILRQIHFTRVLAYIVTRQVKRIRTGAQMCVLTMENSLNGRILLGRSGIGWQLAQHLIGSQRLGGRLHMLAVHTKALKLLPLRKRSSCRMGCMCTVLLLIHR